MIKAGDLVVSILEPNILMGVLRVDKDDEFPSFTYSAQCLYYNGNDYEVAIIPVEFLRHNNSTTENVLSNEHVLYTNEGDTELMRTPKNVG
jgi:hypothetical protein